MTKRSLARKLEPPWVQIASVKSQRAPDLVPTQAAESTATSQVGRPERVGSSRWGVLCQHRRRAAHEWNKCQVSTQMNGTSSATSHSGTNSVNSHLPGIRPLEHLRRWEESEKTTTLQGKDTSEDPREDLDQGPTMGHFHPQRNHLLSSVRGERVCGRSYFTALGGRL